MKDIDNFEKKIKRLEDIVDKLEGDDKTLTETVTLFQEGMKLSKDCRTTLDNIEQIITESTISDTKIKKKKVEIEIE